MIYCRSAGNEHIAKSHHRCQSAALAGNGTYQAHEASAARTQVQALLQQQAAVADQLQQLSRERDEATNRLKSVSSEAEAHEDLAT